MKIGKVLIYRLYYQHTLGILGATKKLSYNVREVCDTLQGIEFKK